MSHRDVPDCYAPAAANVSFDRFYPELTLREVATLLPGLREAKRACERSFERSGEPCGTPVGSWGPARRAWRYSGKPVRVGGRGGWCVPAGEAPASSSARWVPGVPASCSSWVRQEKPSARIVASAPAARTAGSSDVSATATETS